MVTNTEAILSVLNQLLTSWNIEQ